MRKLGICVLLAGAVASFPAAHALDAQDVVADAPPTDEVAPTDETIGAVDDGTVFTTQIEESGEVLPPELVDPQPGDDGEVVDGGGEVIDDGGEIVDDGGEIIDGGGEVVDDGGEVVDDGGEIIDDGGEVVDDGGEIIDDGGEIDVGEVVDETGTDPAEPRDGDGTVGEEVIYTMGPGDVVDTEVVVDDAAAGGDPKPVEGQLGTDDQLMYATGAPETNTDTAGPLESREATDDASLPAEVDDAARADEALPAAFPAPMDVMDSERPKH